MYFKEAWVGLAQAFIGFFSEPLIFFWIYLPHQYLSTQKKQCSFSDFSSSSNSNTTTSTTSPPNTPLNNTKTNKLSFPPSFISKSHLFKSSQIASYNARRPFTFVSHQIPKHDSRSSSKATALDAAGRSQGTSIFLRML